ncbi:AAA family ATPase [Flavobacterium sp.]|uniref:McrB family protein n=1 Tax=Flavobacterium sp. TaxID=239 RepID=UPI002489596D|nr:AAA family ATPase [Flavobacterium sp.]MDI1316897.1 AAA family ATPase [Flavobacterium sp.]
MRNALFPKFRELYQTYQSSRDYTERKKQFAVVPLNKQIIEETLKNNPLENEHLTGLIQMFKYGCSDKTFDKYLKQNVSDATRYDELSKLAVKIDQWGYTGAGLNAVTNLTQKQLSSCGDFLKEAFTITTIDEAVKLCADFDKLGIPLIKSGIYSPWLYYINPELFPILNNSHLKFRDWLDIPADYPSCIKDFNELRALSNDTENGLLDKFAFNFDKYINVPTQLVNLDLKGKKIYKISHGIFKKSGKYKYTGIANVLEQNNWICLNSYTGRSQGKQFANDIKIGDFVYTCYGGDDLYCIGRVISNSKPLDTDSDELIKGDGEWIYREIEPLFYPINNSVRELKGDTRFFMPSGNSTFYEVPKGELDFMNKSIFQPKYNVNIIDGGNGANPPLPPTIANPHNNNNNQFNMTLNTILFGPPGTGKTYSTIDLALNILNVNIENLPREQRKSHFTNFQKDNRVFFTTFHQNMAYEDFIEGIKPLEPKEDDEFLKYEIQDGLFMKACIEATYNFIKRNFPDNEQEIQIRTFNQLYDQLYDDVEQAGETALNTLNGGNVLVSVTEQGNFSVKHVNGVRTYTVSRNRLAPLFERFPDLAVINNIHEEFRNIIGGCNSTAFWSVLNAIQNLQPNQEQDDNDEIELKYEDKKNIVKSYWKNAEYQLFTNDNSEPFVFIIDEINRGNVAQIFGELITLIEEDKRLGKAEEIRLELPYSKTPFCVPPNLYIVGTMNTADKSVEALDTALRRRFSFVPKLPEEDKLSTTTDGINLVLMLTKINERLKVLKDSDHTIGHAWLWNIYNVTDLRKAFSDKIIPLLQEYFYNDYEKLGLVLGDNFFEIKEQISSDIFAPFSAGNGIAGQYDQSWQYKLKACATLTIEDFQSLY